MDLTGEFKYTRQQMKRLEAINSSTMLDFCRFLVSGPPPAGNRAYSSAKFTLF